MPVGFKEVCAGIVTFNPDISLLQENIKALYKQVDKVFIVDNGSINYAEVKNNFGEVCSIISLESNEGIATALNILCRTAKQNGYNWILTMDQDSICADNMVNILRENAEDDRLGIVAPSVEFWVDNILIHATKNKKKEVESINACITSGSLTSIYAWEMVGGFDEWMFIDHVDNDFCTNLIINGYKVMRVNSAILYQRAGDMNYVRIPFGRKVLISNYSPFRNYYICRNTIYFIKKYSKDINIVDEIKALVYQQIIKIIFEKNKFDSVKSMYRGIRDGIRKK